MKQLSFYGTPLPGAGREPCPGKLIVVEGTDGVGRSTHIELLRAWLESRGHAVIDTGMTRSVLAGRGIKEAKTGTTLGRLTMQLFYATDFADRLENEMLPALRAGFVVLTDRYIYTAFARDVARGCDRAWVRDVYRFAVRPTVAFFFRAPLDVAIDRIVSGRPQLKHYEAGLDMQWTDDPEESFTIFQGKILAEYDRMVEEFGLTVIDATRKIERQQREMRAIVRAHLNGRTGGAR